MFGEDQLQSNLVKLTCLGLVLLRNLGETFPPGRLDRLVGRWIPREASGLDQMDPPYPFKPLGQPNRCTGQQRWGCASSFGGGWAPDFSEVFSHDVDHGYSSWIRTKYCDIVCDAMKPKHSMGLPNLAETKKLVGDIAGGGSIGGGLAHLLEKLVGRRPRRTAAKATLHVQQSRRRGAPQVRPASGRGGVRVTGEARRADLRMWVDRGGGVTPWRSEGQWSEIHLQKINLEPEKEPLKAFD